MNILPFTERDLYKLPGVGLKQIDVLTKFFAEHGLRFMTHDEELELILDAKKHAGIKAPNSNSTTP